LNYTRAPLLILGAPRRASQPHRVARASIRRARRDTRRTMPPRHRAPALWDWSTRSGSTHRARARRCRAPCRSARPAG